MLAIAATLALALAPATAQEAPERPFTYDGAPPVQEQRPEDVPVPDTATVEAATAASRRLDLGAYSPYVMAPQPAADTGPRFDTTIEVVDKLPRDPNDVMAEWWRHWNFEYSIYGHGINIQQPMPGGGYNILPLIDWLVDKAKDAKRNRPPEPE
jgi:hypothetical protein